MPDSVHFTKKEEWRLAGPHGKSLLKIRGEFGSSVGPPFVLNAEAYFGLREAIEVSVISESNDTPYSAHITNGGKAVYFRHREISNSDPVSEIELVITGKK